MAKKNSISYKMLAFFIAFFIVIAVLAVYGAENFNGHDESIEGQQYCKISTSDLVKNNSNSYIYLITWDGSPFGDSSSWVIYNFLNSSGYAFTNASYNLTYSMHSYEYNSTPGIIFSHNMTVTYDNEKTTVVPIYLYGENITGNNLLSKGLSILQKKAPENIYREVKIYTTEAILDGTNQPSDNLTNITHVNTVIITDGHAGAYMYNGYILDPTMLNYTHGNTVKSINSDLSTNHSHSLNSALDGLDETLKDVK